MKPAARSLDASVATLVSRLPEWVHPFMQLMTWIGEPAVTVGITGGVIGYGIALNKPVYFTVGLIAIITILLSTLIKYVLNRTRPASEYVKRMFFKTPSFPSGHATGSLVSFGLAAIVIAGKWPEHETLVWTAAIGGAFLVGVSRIYLKAHYATDVIGGWLLASLGIIGILLVFE